jgi:hypothetical protein
MAAQQVAGKITAKSLCWLAKIFSGIEIKMCGKQAAGTRQ